MSDGPHRIELIDQPLAAVIAVFLADLATAQRSPHTQRAYAGTLRRLVAFHPTSIQHLTADILQAFFASMAHLSAASRARQQAAISSFCAWAVRWKLLPQNPMAQLERVRLDPPAPRGVPRAQVETIFAAIPRQRLRDRLLFQMIFELGLRVSEALQISIEDLDLTPDNEHLRITGKGGRQRIVLLDDPTLVSFLRRYLKHTGYRHGSLFRAEKNGDGAPLRYQSVQARWQQYCRQAAHDVTLHQLRHTHATELVNGGVSLATIRKRLGHKRIQTTLRYAEQTDATADRELRAWRRRQITGQK